MATLQTLGWVATFIAFVYIFSKGETPIRPDYISALTLVLFLSIPTWININFLIRRFLRQEKYLIYCLCFVLITLSFAAVTDLIFQDLLNSLFPKIFFLNTLTLVDFVLIFFSFLLLVTLIKMASDWVWINAEENQQLKDKNQLVSNQLTTLRAQMNPHFLFNSLNVIYSLSLENNKETPEAIVQLSDILRHVIYDGQSNSIKIKDEIALIKNYIEFQNYKLSQQGKVNFQYQVEDEDYKIHPMLLLPLVENSYKHGKQLISENQTIDIKLTQKKGHFRFEISNPYDSNRALSQKKDSGIGLENIRNNLNLVYPTNHIFDLVKSDSEFKVILQIEE